MYSSAGGLCDLILWLRASDPIMLMGKRERDLKIERNVSMTMYDSWRRWDISYEKEREKIKKRTKKKTKQCQELSSKIICAQLWIISQLFLWVSSIRSSDFVLFYGSKSDNNMGISLYFNTVYSLQYRYFNTVLPYTIINPIYCILFKEKNI